MHGTEHCKQKRRTLCLSIPQPPSFPGCRINTLTRAARPLLLGTGRSVSAFRSPATTPALAGPIPGSMFPACYFAPSTVASTARSTLGSTTSPGSPRIRPLHRLQPVAASATASACRASCLHSPSGLLHPSRSKRSAGFAACQSAFRSRPISVRSPPPLSITSVSAADHRSRSATFPEARCALACDRHQTTIPRGNETYLPLPN